MVGVEEGREFRFRGDLYSQESTFPLVSTLIAVFVIRGQWYFSNNNENEN